jgi:cytochrome c-type biogenesis protein CcmH/NrfG
MQQYRFLVVESVLHSFIIVQAMPQDADVLVALGVLYNLSSDYPLAVDAFAKAATLRPQDPSIWNKLGATQANSERSAEAVGAYQKHVLALSSSLLLLLCVATILAHLLVSVYLLCDFCLSFSFSSCCLFSELLSMMMS